MEYLRRSSANKITKNQNKAARVITKSDYDAEAGPLINELGWKTVRELIMSDTAVMTFKIMNNMALQYLTGIFQQLRDVHELTLKHSISKFPLCKPCIFGAFPCIIREQCTL